MTSFIWNSPSLVWFHDTPPFLEKKCDGPELHRVIPGVVTQPGELPPAAVASAHLAHERVLSQGQWHMCICVKCYVTATCDYATVPLPRVAQPGVADLLSK